MKNLYIITATKNQIKVFNSKTGTLLKTFILPGNLVNGPVQSDDIFTVVIDLNGQQQGRIYKLPNCFLQRTFKV